MKEPKPFLSLLRRRSCLVPTWRGWLLLLTVIVVGFVVALRTIHPFLAITAPVNGEVLAVEGWVPDYAMQAAVAEFRRNPYRALYVTGGPIEQGAPMSEFKTYAELGAAIIARLGLETNVVWAIPAPLARTDRTFTSAVALNRWLKSHDRSPKQINVLSKGAHARRTRLLFEKVFGTESEIGIIAVEDESYDPKRWWQSSRGFREVIGESIAYVYARLLFRAPRDKS